MNNGYAFTPLFSRYMEHCLYRRAALPSLAIFLNRIALPLAVLCFSATFASAQSDNCISATGGWYSINRGSQQPDSGGTGSNARLGGGTANSIPTSYSPLTMSPASVSCGGPITFTFASAGQQGEDTPENAIITVTSIATVVEYPGSPSPQVIQSITVTPTLKSWLSIQMEAKAMFRAERTT